MLTHTDARYSADITAGSLKLPESRLIADLLLKQTSSDGWQAAIVDQNVLQARSSASAIRVARLLRKRLELMRPALWQLVRDGTGNVATHAVLAATVKHSLLLGDFLDFVVREQYRVYAATLPKRLWDDYLHGCRERDPEMPLWNETTRRKCGTVVYHILEQAGYIENTRSLKLQTVHIAEPVIKYLRDCNEQRVRRCIEVAP